MACPPLVLRRRTQLPCALPVLCAGVHAGGNCGGCCPPEPVPAGRALRTAAAGWAVPPGCGCAGAGGALPWRPVRGPSTMTPWPSAASSRSPLTRSHPAGRQGFLEEGCVRWIRPGDPELWPRKQIVLHSTQSTKGPIVAGSRRSHNLKNHKNSLTNAFGSPARPPATCRCLSTSCSRWPTTGRCTCACSSWRRRARWTAASPRLRRTATARRQVRRSLPPHPRPCSPAMGRARLLSWRHMHARCLCTAAPRHAASVPLRPCCTFIRRDARRGCGQHRGGHV